MSDLPGDLAAREVACSGDPEGDLLMVRSVTVVSKRTPWPKIKDVGIIA